MRKGQKHTEETKRKIREGNLGKKVSEETRRKMREAWKTRPPVTPEVRKKMADSLRGRKYSDEHRAAISEGLKGEGNPMYGKKGKGNPNYGRKTSEETKKLLSEMAKGKYVGEKNPMYGRRGEKSPLFGRNHSKETIEKIRKTALARLGGVSFEPYSPEFNKELKKLIRERDNYTCQYMGESARSVHHIDYNKKNADPANLITLCRSCHSISNNNRPYWKRLFTDMIRTGLKFN